MIRRASVVACAMTIALVSPAFAEGTISGTVKHVDDTGRIIEFTDGRIVHLAYEPVVDDTRVTSVRPGMYIVVPSDFVVVSERSTSRRAPAAAVAEPTIRGTVTRVDPGTQTIVLSDGRMVQTSAATVVVVGDRTVEVTAVQPGDTVVITTTEVAPSAWPRSGVAMAAARVLIVREPEAI